MLIATVAARGVWLDDSPDARKMWVPLFTTGEPCFGTVSAGDTRQHRSLRLVEKPDCGESSPGISIVMTDAEPVIGDSSWGHVVDPHTAAAATIIASNADVILPGTTIRRTHDSESGWVPL